MANEIQRQGRPVNLDELTAKQNKLRDELAALRNDKHAKPEDVKDLKAKVAEAVAARRTAEAAEANA